ncbi:FAA hydrolase family protein [Noviherbaspirillum cavernae]|uniref:FAA hydrolase family protein n=1 Tax=Noviherbaspirillum cavernae TaxID=2320862 RepID=A0A418WWS3_9BURK|nr:fumarylacetoacetate hydrolase family protein [Noviherbaspirillum cavernae]RJG04684.1 FAA hydrolase family protein [Noviherbaspirillum cavernae]
MRFGTLNIDGHATVVAISEDGLQYREAQELLPGFAGDMSDFIARMPVPPTEAAQAGAWQAIAGKQLLAPIPVPRRNIFCVGKNYHEHAKEFSQSGFDTSATKGEVAPSAPVVFTKAPSTVIADRQPVQSFPDITTQLDYEAELAVVIGKPGRGISKADALRHVWGYTIVNDVTARDLQQRHRQWFLGKSMDTFCPMGPWIVTADGIDSATLGVRCWINDELRQDANTRDLIFDIPTIIETISAGISLQPGDVIATGTPAGVGLGFNPPKFLKSGDVMTISIDRIGTLTNRVE